MTVIDGGKLPLKAISSSHANEERFGMSAHHNIKQRARDELKRFMIMFAYLLVIFTLFQLHEYVILRQHDLPYTRFGFGVIKALILAKVMLIGEAMKLGRRLSALPRIWIVIGRAALFALFFLAFELVEEGIRALLTGKDLLHGIAAPGGSALASVVVAMIMCVMLIPYFAFGELGRTFGAENIRRLLFSPETEEPAAGASAAVSGHATAPVGLPSPTSREEQPCCFS